MSGGGRSTSEIDARDAGHAGQVGPDGQAIIGHQQDIREDRRQIQRNAAVMEARSAEERARDPSARFRSSSRAQVGPVLALLAGLFTLAFRTWPVGVPQGQGTLGTPWFLCATLAGVLYLAGFFFSDRHPRRARLVLICGALLQLFVGALAAGVVDAQEVAPAWGALLYDAIPAVVALIAAFLISTQRGQEQPTPDR